MPKNVATDIIMPEVEAGIGLLELFVTLLSFLKISKAKIFLIFNLSILIVL